MRTITTIFPAVALVMGSFAHLAGQDDARWSLQGEWVEQTREVQVPPGIRLSDAQVQEVGTKLAAVAEILRRVPFLNDPRGFNVYPSARIGGSSDRSGELPMYRFELGLALLELRDGVPEPVTRYQKYEFYAPATGSGIIVTGNGVALGSHSVGEEHFLLLPQEHDEIHGHVVIPAGAVESQPRTKPTARLTAIPSDATYMALAHMSRPPVRCFHSGREGVRIRLLIPRAHELIIRPTRLARAAALGGILVLATACAEDPPPPMQLGPHDGLQLPPEEPERVAVGDVAPDFTLLAHEGNAITL